MPSDYYTLRSEVARILPRATKLFQRRAAVRAVKEKGRKKGYSEYKLTQKEWVGQERLLPTEEIGSFVEVSCRAAACPMPLNADVYDSLRCPFACRYCWADNLRATLYTSFFDNARSIGVRHCNPDYFKTEYDKLLENWRGDPHAVRGDIAKSVAMGIPLRFGIRFEDFLPAEREMGISLNLLEYLRGVGYPVMINTKSDLVGEDAYVRALAENPGKAAVHVTLITSRNDILKKLEPNAPSYEARMGAMANLAAAGVRVVARIEPYLVFLTDEREDVERYMADLREAGVQHITFDSYSYSAKNEGIRTSFVNEGIDWDRLFLLGCDSQGLGSLLLGEFMKLWRDNGFSCSSFDLGNVPDNNQAVCCEVGDWFAEAGMNWGCTVMAAKFIQGEDGPVGWADFKNWVDLRGGFLSPELEKEVHQLWNNEGSNSAYGHGWARGLTPSGYDKDGMRWSFDDSDWRQRLNEQIDGQD